MSREPPAAEGPLKRAEIISRKLAARESWAAATWEVKVPLNGGLSHGALRPRALSRTGESGRQGTTGRASFSRRRLASGGPPRTTPAAPAAKFKGGTGSRGEETRPGVDQAAGMRARRDAECERRRYEWAPEPN
ncbi:hypothetical protein MTO96_006631 [Rhipicephalus appendiculatus]